MSGSLPIDFDPILTLPREEAIITRMFYVAMDEANEVPLKETVAEVARIVKLPVDTVVIFRRKLASKYGLLQSTKREGNKFWISLTEKGEIFRDWMLEDGVWGTDDHQNMAPKAPASVSSWDFGDHGFIIDEPIPRDVWKKLNAEAKSKGFLNAYVPANEIIAHIVKNDEGKRAANRLPNWTDIRQLSDDPGETDAQKADRLEAEARRLRGGN